MALAALAPGAAAGEPAPGRAANPTNEAAVRERERLLGERDAARRAARDDRDELARDREQTRQLSGTPQGKRGPDLRFRLGADLSLLFPDGSLVKGTAAGRGSRLGFADDLGAGGTTASAGLAAALDLGPAGGLWLEASRHALDGARSLSAAMVWHGVALAEGERIETRISGTIAGGGLRIFAGTTPAGPVRLLAGAAYWAQRATLRRPSGGGRIVETIDAFFPFLGATADFPLGGGVTFEPRLRVGMLRYGEGGYAQDNRMGEVSTRLRLSLAPGVELGLGYRFLSLVSARSRDASEEEARLALHALDFVFEIRF